MPIKVTEIRAFSITLLLWYSWSPYPIIDLIINTYWESTAKGKEKAEWDMNGNSLKLLALRNIKSNKG